MALPQPVPGLVIRYSYLWHAEHLQAQEEGRKDRPCAIVAAIRPDESGGVRVLVLPITHRPPEQPGLAVEIPAKVKRRLRLDDAPSWVILTEWNEFVWPGPDLRRVPDTRQFFRRPWHAAAIALRFHPRPLPCPREVWTRVACAPDIEPRPNSRAQARRSWRERRTPEGRRAPRSPQHLGQAPQAALRGFPAPSSCWDAPPQGSPQKWQARAASGARPPQDGSWPEATAPD